MSIEHSPDNFILHESAEISTGEDLTWIKKILSAFPAFKSRNYRLFFSGQFISLIGTWLQQVAQGWLVFSLSHSAYWVGVVAALTSLPSLILSLFGGVMVDRFSKRRILIITQTCAMLLALILGVVTLMHIVSVAWISVLAFLLGMVMAVDAPARQAFSVELVGKSLLPSAIALNSAIFNAARVIGPSIAGLLIVLAGVGVAFILNGLSYLAVIIALFFIHPHETPPATKENTLVAIQKGVHYAFTHPVIAVLLSFIGCISLFGWSFTTMMPVVAENIFHSDARGLGQLYAATGAGAVIAIILISFLGQRFRQLSMVLFGNLLLALSLFFFSMTTQLAWGLLWMFLFGVGLIFQTALINTIIQTYVADHMRGRVMSIFILMFLGVLPAGNFLVGIISEHFGTMIAARINAVMLLSCGIFLAANRASMRRARERYYS